MANETNQRLADAPLMEYRVYVLNECSRIFSPAQIIEAVNDDGAIETAIRIQNGRIIEIWDEARLVMRLKPDGPPFL